MRVISNFFRKILILLVRFYQICISPLFPPNITLENGFLKLPKVGLVRIKQHRPVEGKIKSVTVEVKRSGKVFVSILCEKEVDIEKVEPKTFIGLDYSSPHLYVDSNGNEPDYPRFYRQMEAKLAREQRKLSKMYRDAKSAGRDLKDCKNYQKQRMRVARLHEKVANQRKDFLHKLSKELADTYDVVAIEDINKRNMSQSLRLGKSTMDNGFGMLERMLEYKLEERGRKLVKVDRWFASTKTCSCCGNKKFMRLSDREYVCPECGLVMNRDFNAAINIREEAKRMLSV